MNKNNPQMKAIRSSKTSHRGNSQNLAIDHHKVDYHKELDRINTHLKKKISTIKSNYKNQYIYQYKPNSTKTYEVIPISKGYQHLYDRKESQLNAKYNTRKQKLVSITKTNRKIHERINSQQSKYSARDMNISYETHRSRCDSISRSRCSNRGLKDSRTSSKNGLSRGISRISKVNQKISKMNGKTKSQSTIKLQPLKVNQLNHTQQFKQMFGINKPQTIRVPKRQSNQKKLMTNQNYIEEEDYESPTRIKKSNRRLKQNTEQLIQKQLRKKLPLEKKSYSINRPQSQIEVLSQINNNMKIVSAKPSISRQGYSMKLIGNKMKKFYH